MKRRRLIRKGRCALHDNAINPLAWSSVPACGFNLLISNPASYRDPAEAHTANNAAGNALSTRLLPI